MPNRYQNNIQDERLKMVENHIATFNEEMGQIKIDVAEIKNDVCWLKRSYWVIATASIGALITTLIGFVLRR